MKKSELLTTAQLSRVIGVSRVTLQAWINDGLPIADKDGDGRGTPKNLFCWEDINLWLDEHPKKSARRMNSNACADVTIAMPDIESTESFTPENASQGELLDIERRLQQAEKITHSQWAKAQHDRKSVAVIEKYQKNWLSILDKRMRFERDFAHQLKKIRVNVCGIGLDLAKLSADERKVFNDLISKAEI
ncbi:MAG: hypothetical protein NE330_12175 [Lentisphaeraceae bacterium]|nr:hypothetical protein [Lentisphaeraceae bacterium]